MTNAIELWNRRQYLYYSLHERLAGTRGTKELAELQSIEEALTLFTAEKHHEIIDRAEYPGKYA